MTNTPVISRTARLRRRAIVVLGSLAIAGPLAARELRTLPVPAAAAQRRAAPDTDMLARAIASVRGANLVVCELAAPTMEWDMGSWGGHTPAVDDDFADSEAGEIVRWIHSRH